MTKRDALDTIWMRCQHNDKTFEAYCVLKRELGLNELDCEDRVKTELEPELNELEPKYCDRNICLSNEYNGISCDECEVMKSQEPCEDCISRQAVLEAIDVKAWEFCDYLIRNGRNDEQKPVSLFADNLRECISEDLPPVTPQYTDAEIQKMQELEQAEIQKAYELGKAEMQLSENCISRQEVDTLVDELARAISDERICISRGRSTATIMRDIRHLPPVTPAEKVGHWITWKEAGNEIPSETRFECSVCHDTAQTLCNGLDLLSPYCPNCGAKMEVTDEID